MYVLNYFRVLDIAIPVTMFHIKLHGKLRHEITKLNLKSPSCISKD